MFKTSLMQSLIIFGIGEGFCFEFQSSKEFEIHLEKIKTGRAPPVTGPAPLDPRPVLVATAPPTTAVFQPDHRPSRHSCRPAAAPRGSTTLSPHVAREKSPFHFPSSTSRHRSCLCSVPALLTRYRLLASLPCSAHRRATDRHQLQLPDSNDLMTSCAHETSPRRCTPMPSHHLPLPPRASTVANQLQSLFGPTVTICSSVLMSRSSPATSPTIPTTGRPPHRRAPLPEPLHHGLLYTGELSSPHRLKQVPQLSAFPRRPPCFT
jgi:hypothetical protein